MSSLTLAWLPKRQTIRYNFSQEPGFSAPDVMALVRLELSFSYEEIKHLLLPVSANNILLLLNRSWNGKTRVYCSLKYTFTNYHLLLSLLEFTYVNKINTSSLIFLTLNTERGLHKSLISKSTSEKLPATQMSEAACSLNFKSSSYQPTSITGTYRSIYFCLLLRTDFCLCSSKKKEKVS